MAAKVKVITDAAHPLLHVSGVFPLWTKWRHHKPVSFHRRDHSHEKNPALAFFGDREARAQFTNKTGSLIFWHLWKHLPNETRSLGGSQTSQFIRPPRAVIESDISDPAAGAQLYIYPVKLDKCWA
jgi:hypothetical protein